MAVLEWIIQAIRFLCCSRPVVLFYADYHFDTRGPFGYLGILFYSILSCLEYHFGNLEARLAILVLNPLSNPFRPLFRPQ